MWGAWCMSLCLLARRSGPGCFLTVWLYQPEYIWAARQEYVSLPRSPLPPSLSPSSLFLSPYPSLIHPIPLPHSPSLPLSISLSLSLSPYLSSPFPSPSTPLSLTHSLCLTSVDPPPPSLSLGVGGELRSFHTLHCERK